MLLQLRLENRIFKYNVVRGAHSRSSGWTIATFKYKNSTRSTFPQLRQHLRRATCTESLAQSNLRSANCTEHLHTALAQSNLHRPTCTEHMRKALARSNWRRALAQSNLLRALAQRCARDPLRRSCASKRSRCGAVRICLSLGEPCGDCVCRSAFAVVPCNILARETASGSCLVVCAPAFAIARSRVRFPPGPRQLRLENRSF